MPKLLDLPPDPNTPLDEESNGQRTRSHQWQGWLYKLWVSVTQGIVLSTSSQTLGAATLVAGTVTIPSTKVTANSLIFYSVKTASNPGILSTSSRIVGTSFTVLSSSPLDVSSISWILIEPV